MNKEQLISEMLLLPTTVIEYHLSEHLVQLFPNKPCLKERWAISILKGSLKRNFVSSHARRSFTIKWRRIGGNLSQR